MNGSLKEDLAKALQGIDESITPDHMSETPAEGKSGIQPTKNAGTNRIGRHLFTMRRQKKSKPVMHFPLKSDRCCLKLPDEESVVVKAIDISYGRYLPSCIIGAVDFGPDCTG